MEFTIRIGQRQGQGRTAGALGFDRWVAASRGVAVGKASAADGGRRWDEKGTCVYLGSTDLDEPQGSVLRLTLCRMRASGQMHGLWAGGYR